MRLIITAAFQGKAPKSGTMTPSKLNSLSAIAGHEGDEEEWEREMRESMRHGEEVSRSLFVS